MTITFVGDVTDKWGMGQSYGMDYSEFQNAGCGIVRSRIIAFVLKVAA